MEILIDLLQDPATHRDLLGMLVRDGPAVFGFAVFGGRMVKRIEAKIDARIGPLEKRIEAIERAGGIPHVISDRITEPGGMLL